jgi:hypothetical protein
MDDIASRKDKVANMNPIKENVPETVRGSACLAHRTHPHTTPAGKAQYIAIAYKTSAIDQAALFMRMPSRHRSSTSPRVHPQINLIE